MIFSQSKLKSQSVTPNQLVTYPEAVTSMF